MKAWYPVSLVEFLLFCLGLGCFLALVFLLASWVETATLWTICKRESKKENYWCKRAWTIDPYKSLILAFIWSLSLCKFTTTWGKITCKIFQEDRSLSELHVILQYAWLLSCCFFKQKKNPWIFIIIIIQPLLA